MLFPTAADLAALHGTRELLLGRGLAVLAAWVLANLLVSGYCLAHAHRHRVPYYFHGMNVGWALVNAGLAFWGILHLHPLAPAGLRLADIMQEQLFNESLFLLNAGLDVAYVMTGFYLRAQAAGPHQPHPARLVGFGRSLWVQGGFLLIFDVGMWTLLHGQGKNWIPLLT